MSGPIPGSECRLRFRQADTAAPFQNLEGLRVASWRLLQDEVEITTLADNGWRRLLSRGGSRGIEVRASGLYLGSEAETSLRELALAGIVAECEMRLDDTLAISGPFLIVELSLVAATDDEAAYETLLRSAGPIVIL